MTINHNTMTPEQEAALLAQSSGATELGESITTLKAALGDVFAEQSNTLQGLLIKQDERTAVLFDRLRTDVTTYLAQQTELRQSFEREMMERMRMVDAALAESKHERAALQQQIDRLAARFEHHT